MSEARVGALILAGGRSSRMGAEKAALQLGARPLLNHVLDIVGEVADVRVVCARSGQELPTFDEDVVRVDDPPDLRDCGPLAGVATGLAVLQARGVGNAVLTASDAVYVSAKHLGAMLRALADGRDAVVPAEHASADDGTNASRVRLHPLAGAVRVEPALEHAQAMISDGRRSLQALYLGLDAHQVFKLEDPDVLRGCNTPEEWAEALARRSTDG